MARRARKGVDASHIAIIAGVVVAIAAIVFFMAKRSSDPMAGLNELPLDTYVNNGNSLTKQTFKINATIIEKARFTEKRGQFVYVRFDEGGEPQFAGLHIPPEFDSENLGAGDTINAMVEVQRSGALAVLELH